MDEFQKQRAGREILEGARTGRLYLVATPIGNLQDLSFRALEVLRAVDRILCEDTRTSRRLLDHYGIDKPLLACHAFNEAQRVESILERLANGETLALISDAGTPLINDPGFPLVAAARSRQIEVIPIPGPCALIAALSASGLPTSRFAFEGFPPRREAARRAAFEALLEDDRTLVFYESSHRLLSTLAAMTAVFESRRRLVIAREISKRFETFLSIALGDALALVENDPDQQKGEFVLILEGRPAELDPEALGTEALRVLDVLLLELPPSAAARVAAQLTGARRQRLYEEALRRAGRLA
jgi:16S rRNA (cytidine1402-2'-O)-methyltransferase